MGDRGRGRPPTFTPEQRQQLAELVRLFGIRGTIRLTKPTISAPTLGKIAHEFGIRLSVGRRPINTITNSKESVGHSMSYDKDGLPPSSKRMPAAA